MKGQTRKHSLAEAVFNVVIGYGIAIAAQVTIFPLFGFSPPLEDNLKIGALFTVVSLVRSYILRRAFNWIMLHGVTAPIILSKQERYSRKRQKWRESQETKQVN